LIQIFVLTLDRNGILLIIRAASETDNAVDPGAGSTASEKFRSLT